MIRHQNDRFEPDYIVHPGEILDEVLEARHITKTDLAKKSQLSEKTISQIINGKAPISPDTAIKFERVLGIPASTWSNLESLYQTQLAKLKDRKELEKHTEWAKKFPLSDLRKMGYIGKERNQHRAVEQLLDFFGIASVEAWERECNRITVRLRKSPSFESCQQSVAAWLRIAELEAATIETKPYSAALFRKALRSIRGLTAEEPSIFQPRMVEICSESGVALVFVPELKNTRLSGATRWLYKDRALIALSLRHKTDDHLWFTLFHEAGHILLHGKKDVFIDEDGMNGNVEEDQANTFAANTLIPRRDYDAFIKGGRLYKPDIMSFAKSMGIAPGIVVGRLQHEGRIPYSWHNDLKRSFRLVQSA